MAPGSTGYCLEDGYFLSSFRDCYWHLIESGQKPVCSALCLMLTSLPSPTETTVVTKQNALPRKVLLTLLSVESVYLEEEG